MREGRRNISYCVCSKGVYNLMEGKKRYVDKCIGNCLMLGIGIWRLDFIECRCGLYFEE